VSKNFDFGRNWAVVRELMSLPVAIISSGVARVPCALGQEIFLQPLSTKTTEFEVKNSFKILEDAKFVLV